MSTENLKAEAESLGIKVDGRWSDERIQAEIDEALGDGGSGGDDSDRGETEASEQGDGSDVDEPNEPDESKSDDEGDTPDPDASGDDGDEQDEPEAFTVKNVGTCHYRINNGRVPPGGEYTFTEQDMASDRLMRKTRHAIGNKLLKQV